MCVGNGEENITTKIVVMSSRARATMRKRGGTRQAGTSRGIKRSERYT